MYRRRSDPKNEKQYSVHCPLRHRVFDTSFTLAANFHLQATIKNIVTNQHCQVIYTSLIRYQYTQRPLSTPNKLFLFVFIQQISGMKKLRLLRHTRTDHEKDAFCVLSILPW
jgi:hypothetical protein